MNSRWRPLVTKLAAISTRRKALLLVTIRLSKLGLLNPSTHQNCRLLCRLLHLNLTGCYTLLYRLLALQLYISSWPTTLIHDQALGSAHQFYSILRKPHLNNYPLHIRISYFSDV